MGNDDFSEKVAEVDRKKPYLPVRGREPLDGGGQALRGEPHRLRCELFVREDEAQHVKRVHLGNVHALARAASHLAAADVLAVVVLRIAYWTYFFKPLGVSSVNKKRVWRFKGDGGGFYDEKKRDKNRKARSFSRV